MSFQDVLFSHQIGSALFERGDPPRQRGWGVGGEFSQRLIKGQFDRRDLGTQRGDLLGRRVGAVDQPDVRVLESRQCPVGYQFPSGDHELAHSSAAHGVLVAVTL